MAGVIDLKGRMLYKNNQMRASRQIVLAVRSAERMIISQLSAMTGTRPEMTPKRPLKDFMRKGCAEHCPEEHVHVGFGDLAATRDFSDMPETGLWTITGASMAVVINNLSPYLTIDRGYAEAIDEVNLRLDLTGRGATQIRASLLRLRELGWEIDPRYEVALHMSPYSSEERAIAS
jgi:hypothetical protein